MYKRQLYELFPDSPYELPCYLSRPRSGLFCKKPVFSREGHNVSVVDIRDWEEYVRLSLIHIFTVSSDWGEDIFVDTNDVWDNGDHVGISIFPESRCV